MITARPMPSLFRARPGPEVEVTAMLPAKEAPMAEHTPAISSSIWHALTPRSLRLASSWRMSVAGVMGYEPRKRGLPLRWEAMMRPQAVAVLPLTSV